MAQRFRFTIQNPSNSTDPLKNEDAQQFDANPIGKLLKHEVKAGFNIAGASLSLFVA